MFILGIIENVFVFNLKSVMSIEPYRANAFELNEKLCLTFQKLFYYNSYE